jgi:ATP/maltotriose-dependent transcriptional regulator MalT
MSMSSSLIRNAAVPELIAPAVVRERRSRSRADKARALLALSHTAVEHRLYLAMLGRAELAGANLCRLSLQELSETAPAHSYSTIRRAVAGLLAKRSIERSSDAAGRGSAYLVFGADEVFARRRSAGIAPYPKEYRLTLLDPALHLAAEQIVGYQNLSRREAQIALCCVEGMTNSQIGGKLCVSEQTVKTHMRNIFSKMGVRRRTELVARLLQKRRNEE